MECRLVVDLSSGHLEVSGSEELVKHVFGEFRQEISARYVEQCNPQRNGQETPQEGRPTSQNDTQTKDTPVRKAKTVKTTGTAAVNKDLDTSGLEDFYDRYLPKSDAEKALIFSKFLDEIRGIAPCNQTDLYSCFFAMKHRIKLPSMLSLMKNDANRTKFFSVVGSGPIDSLEVAVAA